jgi:hypothetical protein
VNLAILIADCESSSSSFSSSLSFLQSESVEEEEENEEEEDLWFGTLLRSTASLQPARLLEADSIPPLVARCRLKSAIRQAQACATALLRVPESPVSFCIQYGYSPEL